MSSSLSELQRAIKGLVVMSAELEAMYHSMAVNQVRTACKPRRRAVRCSRGLCCCERQARTAAGADCTGCGVRRGAGAN